MSDCNVCIYGESLSVDFSRHLIRKAAKDHVCSECDALIPIGTRYEYSSGKCEGDLWNAKTCLACAEIAKTFYCGGRVYGGGLWDAMRESAFPEFTGGCVNRLRTAAAKAKLMQEYRDWQ